MPQLRSLFRHGHILPLYPFTDPLTDTDLHSFTDPCRVPMKGDWVLVEDSDGRRYQATFDPHSPLPFGCRILGAIRGVVIVFD